MSLKTLHVETGRHLYGGALQASYLARGLQARGHKAVVLCLRGSGVHRELEGQVPVRAIRFTGEADPRLLIGAIRAIREERPDVVHLHSRRGADTLVGIAARLCRVPAVILSRRVDDPISRSLPNALRFKLCDRVVAISEGIRKVVLDGGIPAYKVECVHSAIDVSAFNVPRDRKWFESEFQVAEDEKAIGAIAQLIERKGHSLLIRGMPEILKRFSRCRVMFFGKGARQGELAALAESVGVADKLIFAGFRTDMPRVLPNLDLVVHPAEMEGLGVSLLQAAAAGVPIVASAAGGIPEIVIDGETGRLVPVNDVDALKAAVIEALSDRTGAERMAANARRHVESSFGLDQMIEGNLRVYFEVLRSKGYERGADDRA